MCWRKELSHIWRAEYHGLLGMGFFDLATIQTPQILSLSPPPVSFSHWGCSAVWTICVRTNWVMDRTRGEGEIMIHSWVKKKQTQPLGSTKLWVCPFVECRGLYVDVIENLWMMMMWMTVDVEWRVELRRCVWFQCLLFSHAPVSQSVSSCWPLTEQTLVWSRCA